MVGWFSRLTVQHEERALQSLVVLRDLTMSFHIFRSIWRKGHMHLQFPPRKVWSSRLDSVNFYSVIFRTIRKLHTQKELEVVFVLEEKRISFS